MSIDGAIGITATINDRQSAGLAGSSFNIPTTVNPSVTFSNGSGAAQGTMLYAKQRTLSGTTDTVVLTSLTDNHGNAIDFATIKGIVITNVSASNNIVVGDAGSDAWATLLNATGTITLPPGASFCAFTPDATGWTVTASTAMNLLVTGTSGQSYNLVLLG